MLAALVAATLLSACGPPRIYRQNTFPVCEGRTRASHGPLGNLYSPMSGSSCRQVLTAEDVSGWVESPLNSHRRRGLRTIVLGCTNLTPSAESCEYGGPEGNAGTLDMVFDFTRYPDTARVQRAVLAVYAFNNASFLTQESRLRGRLVAGDTYASLGAQRQPPSGSADWIMFDITDIAARAIADRRTQVHFEISLPCGRTEQELSTVGVLSREPVVLVEYK